MTKRCQYQPRESLPASGFDNTYQLIATLSAPAIIIKMINNSDTDVDVSTDATTDHDVVPSGSFFLYDIRTNHGREQQLAFPIGTTFYVKGAAAGIGDVFFVALNEGQ